MAAKGTDPAKASYDPFPSAFSIQKEAWNFFVDELIPRHVKLRYSPDPRWAEKPFDARDAQFFSRGIIELSERFTDDRSTRMHGRELAYFRHPRFRSSYLLYFLPLQAAKFAHLFETHSRGILNTFKIWMREFPNEPFTIADLGAGPATGALAFLLWLRSKGEKFIPPLEFWCVDHDEAILRDGESLMLALAEEFKIQIQIRTRASPWEASVSRLPAKLGLTLLGHVLNETAQPPPREDFGLQAHWVTLLQRSETSAGILILEPALRTASQNLARLRDRILVESPRRLWGPCLHVGACPLSQGRDWCHFSSPIAVPGRWFRFFSNALGSERSWLKFSYLWLSGGQPAPAQPPSRLRRIVSDPLGLTRGRTGGGQSVLLCEPDRPGKWKLPHSSQVKSKLHRGDFIEIPNK